jgi:hypothetical protein
MPAIFGQAAVQPDTEHDLVHVMFPVLRDSDGAAHRDPALRRPLRIGAPVRLY